MEQVTESNENNSVALSTLKSSARLAKRAFASKIEFSAIFPKIQKRSPTTHSSDANLETNAFCRPREFAFIKNNQIFHIF